MKADPRFVLQNRLAGCRVHADALQDALGDLIAQTLTSDALRAPTKDLRRLLDQFAYRFTRLQDDMGAKLFADILTALGEDAAAWPVLDRLARLEQIGWLPDAETWQRLRFIRNEFVHEYPEDEAEREERLRLALEAAAQLLTIFQAVSERVNQRFGF